MKAALENCFHLTVEIVREIHAEAIKRFGGSDGVRELALLESAVAAPQASFSGQSPYKDIVELAAAYLFYLCKNHPFVDGNGRIARIMMSAELVSAGRSTIIIPTVYRDDYLQALRALTRRHRPNPLVAMLTAAQKFSHLGFSPYPSILNELQRRNWFREPDEARIIP